MANIIIASGPVVVENDKVMLNKSGSDDFWKFCGGRVKDQDVDFEATAKRRVKEEMGIDINIIDLNPFLMRVKEEKDGHITEIVLVHFLAKKIGEIKPGEGVREWDWFDVKNLPEGLAPNIEPVLKHFDFI